MEIMKLTIKKDFRFFLSFLVTKITLFENKCDIKLITLISVYHRKLLVSLDRFINPSYTKGEERRGQVDPLP